MIQGTATFRVVLWTECSSLPGPQAPPPHGGGAPLGGALLRGLDEAWRQDLSPPREDPRTPSPGPRRELVPQLAALPT